MDTQFLESIATKLNQATEEMVEKTVNEMLLSDEWVEKIEKLATQRILDKVSSKINAIDVNLAIKDTILNNRDQILGELTKEFKTTGMQDTAKDLQLTIMDDAVVVENELYTNNLSVEQNTIVKGDLEINGDLALKGRVNVDNKSWHELTELISKNTYDLVKKDFEIELVDQLVQKAAQGIDLPEIKINGHKLLENNEFAKTITKSSLTKVGTLDNLSVNGRLGINTDSPTDSLSIWDEEINLVAGKHSKNTAYIGTNKNQDLVIGTNKQKQLTVSADGGVTVNNLTVGTNNLAFDNKVPGYSGTKGDIVFNKDLKDGAPFAWVCLGTYRWQPLHAS